MAARKKGPNLSVGRGEKRSVKQGAGLTAKGRAKYNRKTGSKLKAPVTGKVKPGSKAAKRRKSFCARSKDGKVHEEKQLVVVGSVNYAS